MPCHWEHGSLTKDLRGIVTAFPYALGDRKDGVLERMLWEVRVFF